ncbi:hypothetical protein IAD21_03417 [Abditibacteriota bacterium]|nr:hypothetical protein IAD21_03417 [Abditibacteriota bacterium]
MRRAFTLIEAMLLLFVIVLIPAWILFILWMPSKPPSRYVCLSNLKQIGSGFLQYTQDYGGKFPPSRVKSSTGWADVLQPYIKSRSVFQCPATQNSVSPLTDYFYNRRVSRVPIGKLRFISQTILVGEGDDDRPTWVSLSQMPFSWPITEHSPARRHSDGANYLFVDGHAKWLEPSKVKPTLSRKDLSPTFAIR